MEQIRLGHLLPSVFADKKDLHSAVWLHDVSLQKGKIYLLEAESGAGKSTLCNFLYGLRKDYAGTICFDQQDISDFTPRCWLELRRRSLSHLFQDLALFEELSVWENIEIKNRLTGYSTTTQIEEWLDQLEIGPMRNQRVATLSFGQKQRVALLRALCQPFDFLLLDEPISHLDDRISTVFSGLIHDQQQKRGAGILLTSIGKHPDLPYDEILTL